METKQIDKMHVQFINVKQDEIYVSFRLKAGFVQKEYASLRALEKKKITINSASSGVFAFYLKQQFHQETGKSLIIKGFSNALTITMQTSVEQFHHDFEVLTNLYFQEHIPREQMQRAIDTFIQWFKEAYKDLAFRSRLNTWEFSHQMKNYRMMRFLHDIETYSVEDFNFFKEQMIGYANTGVLITGDEAAIREHSNFFFDEGSIPKKMVSPLIPVKASLDPFLFQDQYRMKYDVQLFHEGSIRFDRLDTRFSNNDMYAILQIIARCLFQQNYEVDVDSFDASITYYNQNLREYKNSLLAVLTEEKIKRAVASFQNEMKFILFERPITFNQYYQYLEANNISYLDVLLNMEQICLEEIQMALPFLKLSECHLDVRMKGVSVNGK